MNRPRCFLFWVFLALAPVLHAQTAINSGAATSSPSAMLPLRNLQIEVRQRQREDTARAAVEAAATLLMVPLGEWITVAQSEQETASTRSGLDGNAAWTVQSGTEVQVRVSAP